MKLKQFDRGRFRKYALYAVGEMALIVFGILIALQIDNWNTNRKEQATLDNYLQSIATNVSGDLASLAIVRAKREDTFERTYRTYYVQTKQAFTPAELAFSQLAIEGAREETFLNSNLGGYEALKSSGSLDQLQGTDLEKLIYAYYDTVHRIEQAESSHNIYVQQLWLKVLEHWPRGMEEWEFADPTVLSAERFEELQPSYRDHLVSTYMDALFRQAQSVDPLLLEYERLDELGSLVVRMIDRGLVDFESGQEFPAPYDPDDGLGFADVIVDGRIPWHTFFPITVDAWDYRVTGRLVNDEPGLSAYDFRIFERVDDSLRINYPGGAEWAGFWLGVGDLSYARRSLDYSAYGKVLLELKGDADNETLKLSLEDEDDPAKGTVTIIELDITNEWHTYEIDLDDFEDTDLESLRVVFGLVFTDRPQTIHVRSVKYVPAAGP